MKNGMKGVRITYWNGFQEDFCSIADASEKLGVSRDTIRLHIQKKQKMLGITFEHIPPHEDGLFLNEQGQEVYWSNGNKKKPVIVHYPDGNEKRFPCVDLCSKYVGITARTMIRMICKNEQTFNGLQFRYEGSPFIPAPPKKESFNNYGRKKRPIIVMKEGVSTVYPCIDDVMSALGIAERTIRNRIYSGTDYHGYTFDYALEA